MNPFKEEKPSIYIADIVIEFKYIFGKPTWHRNYLKTKEIVFEKQPILLMNGKIYSKEAENSLIQSVLKSTAYKPVDGTLKIKEIRSPKFSSEISWNFK